MVAIICVTVVLPLLPVTAISGSVEAARARPRPALPARQRVGHHQARQAGLGQAALGERGHRAGRARLRPGNRCASKRSPLQRHEQVARLQRAGVAVHARERPCRRRRPACAPGSSAWACGQGQHHARSCRRGPRAAPAAPRARSENGQLDARDLLVVLVALAGDQHHVPGAASRQRLRDGRARSSMHVDARRGRPAARIWR